MSRPIDIRDRLAVVRSLCGSREGASQVLGLLIASVDKRARGDREAWDRLGRSLRSAELALVDVGRRGEW